MIRTDGTPTIAWAGARGRDRDSKRRWIARRREERAARIARAFAKKRPASVR